MNARFVPTDGIHNLRDYGGYGTAAGGRVRSGLLYRSGQHRGATDGDLVLVDALNLATVVDLRGNRERANHPCRRGPGFRAKVHFHNGETSNAPPHDPASADRLNMADAARQRMIGIYERMPRNPAMRDIFSRYLSALAGEDGVSLVHCFAGKDRTGVAVALLHHILGVHPDDAMADYLLTGDAPTYAVLVEQAVADNRGGWSGRDEQTVRALLGVGEAYLLAFREKVAAEFGTLDAYIAGELGVDVATRDRLVQRFVE